MILTSPGGYSVFSPRKIHSGATVNSQFRPIPASIARDGCSCRRVMRPRQWGSTMTPKLVPALAAALFLAACSSGSHTATPQPPDSNLASGTPNGQVVPGSVEDSESGNIGNTVYFETDSSALTAASQAQLQKEAAWLQQYRQHTATIEGHADERGT